MSIRFCRKNTPTYVQIGIFQVLFLAVGSYVLMERMKVHPALVVAVTLVYGAINF